MSDPFRRGMKITETNEETCRLTAQELGDFNSAGGSWSTFATSDEVARQFETLTDPITRQLKLNCDLMKEIHQAFSRRSEETNGLNQGSARASDHTLNIGVEPFL